MKTPAIALFLCAACSVAAAPPGGERVRYTASFAAGSTRPALEKVVEAYAGRLGKSASAVSFSIDEQASTIRAEMPFAAAFRESKTGATLAEPLAADPHSVAFTTQESVPVRALARIDEEWLRYDAQGGERGLFGTPVAAHAAGAKLQIFEDDRVRMLLGAYGELEFLVAAQTTPEAERERFLAWRKAHPSARLAEFDGLWRRSRSTGEYLLLERPAEARFRFGNAWLANVGFNSDDVGRPALSFEFAKERQGDFGDWTTSLSGKGMAIVLDEEILLLATVRSRLPGGGIITGGPNGFSSGEVEALVQLLRQPRLPLPPLGLSVGFLR